MSAAACCDIEARTHMARVPIKIKPTAEHLLAAFEALRMRWPATTYEAAMQHPVQGRLVTARATAMALREHERTHAPRTELERRFNPATNQWRTYKHAGARTEPSLVPHPEESTDEA